MWRSARWTGVLGLFLMAAGVSLELWQIHAFHVRQSPSLSASTVTDGPALTSGRSAPVHIAFQVPKGYSTLQARFRLLDQRPAGCVGTGQVRVAAYSGTADSRWSRRLQAVETVETPVRVDESKAVVVLSVGLDTPRACRAVVTPAPYVVVDEPGNAPEFYTEGFLSIALAFLGSSGLARCVALTRRRMRREESPDWEPRARLRAAEDRWAETLRRPSGPRPPRPPGGEPAPAGDREPSPAARQPPPDPLALSGLWEVTHARLDVYHHLATGQAARSFRNAQIAMASGFVLLAGFTVLAIVARNPTASVVAGALGVTSAGLAGYVSRTFVRSQESAAEHLRAYFDQPLEFSRFLAAERLVADADLSEEQRARILGDLVRAMIAPGGTGGAAPPDSRRDDAPGP